MRKPNLKTAEPDIIVAWIKFKIRKRFGDEVENASDVDALDHGHYEMTLMAPGYPDGLYVGKFQRAGIPAVISLIETLKV